MSDFVQNYLLHIVIAGLVAEVPRQRDAFGPVVTLTKPGGGAIPFESPLRKQSMGCQEGFRPVLNPFQFRHRSRLVRGEPRGSSLSPPPEKSKSWVDKQPSHGISLEIASLTSLIFILRSIREPRV